MPAIRPLAAQLYKTLTYMKTPPGASNKFQLAAFEMMPVLPLVLTYLYERGAATHSHKTAHVENQAINAFGESAFTYLLAQHTRGIYPLLYAGVTAYDTGTAKGKIEKIKAALRTSLFFPLGYVGIQAGLGITDLQRLREAHRIMDLLQKKHVDYALGKMTDAEKTVMKPLLEKLEQAANSQTKIIERLFKGQNIATKTLGKINTQYNAAQKAFLGVAEGLPLSRLRAMGRKFSYLLTEAKLGQSGHVQFLRGMNPMFGYMLLTSFVALPMLKLLCEKILPEATKMQDKKQMKDWKVQSESSIVPVWFDQVVPVAKLIGSGGHGGHGEDGGHGGGHGTEHEHPLNYGNGPELLNQYWEGSL